MKGLHCRIVPKGASPLVYRDDRSKILPFHKAIQSAELGKKGKRTIFLPFEAGMLLKTSSRADLDLPRS